MTKETTEAIDQHVTAARHFMSDKSSVVPSSYDRVIVALADERDALAAKFTAMGGLVNCHWCNESLSPLERDHWRECKKHPAKAERDAMAAENARLKAELVDATDQRARLVALLREYRRPFMETGPSTLDDRTDAVLAEIGNA